MGDQASQPQDPTKPSSRSDRTRQITRCLHAQEELLKTVDSRDRARANFRRWYHRCTIDYSRSGGRSMLISDEWLDFWHPDRDRPMLCFPDSCRLAFYWQKEVDKASLRVAVAYNRMIFLCVTSRRLPF